MINFNQAPYFDDFDKTNKFYRILYRPSYAVQGRELTQTQSISQEQIKKFGDHIFKNGAMVIPGQVSYDNQIIYHKMKQTYDGIDVDPNNFLGRILVGEESKLEATVMNISPLEDAENPLTFFCKINNAGEGGSDTQFWDGEDVYLKEDNLIRATVSGILDTSNHTTDSSGKCASSSIGEGVYYINGVFVDVDKQSIILSKYDALPSKKIGLRIYETIVTPEDDPSLTDNAQGSPNYAAPGAHRYKINLKLESIDVDTPVSDDFIEIQRIVDGLVTSEIRKSEYSELEKTFARRTYDESGSYTVNPFQISIKEHYRDDNSTIYNEGTFYPPKGDKEKLAVEMSSGKAYVLGYEISKISPTVVEMDKARDTDSNNNSITNFNLGNYVYVSHIHNIARIDEQGTVQIYFLNGWDYQNDITPFPADGVQGDVLIGTARVRALKEDGVGIGGATAYRFHLYDIDMNGAEVSYIDVNGDPVTEKSTFEKHAKWIYDSNPVGTQNFTCRIEYDVNDEYKTYLFDTGKNMMLFPLPHTNIKTLYLGGTTECDTGYAATRAYRNVGLVTGKFRFEAGANEVFQQDTTKILAYNSTDGTIVNYPSGNIEYTGSPIGKIMNITPVGAEPSINIILPVSKQIASEKSKYRILDETIIISEPNKVPRGKDYLGKADIIGVRGVYMSQDFLVNPVIGDSGTKDVTTRYTAFTGQKDNYYDVGYIELKSGAQIPTGRIMVVFDYYEHTDGDYFSVDSYLDHEYYEIPVYQSTESGGTYGLADVYDFRPRMADDRSGFTGIGGSIGDLPQLNADIRSDYDYYLNRIDLLFLNYKGEFKIARGVPEIFPKPPKIPDTAMLLYKLVTKAYTYTPEDVKPEYEDNKRYTMRDIGDIDRRLQNVEYYTSLSLLERATASMEILDSAGLSRFKNGFIVDPFEDHTVGNNTHNDYKCAITPGQGIMRSTFNTTSIEMETNADNSYHYQKTGSYLTLPYDSVPYIEQRKGSVHENINPFAVRTYEGDIKFQPDHDDWYETKDVGELVVNNNAHYAALKAMADKLVGTVWGEWQTNWTGVSKSSTTKETTCRTGVNNIFGFPLCGGKPVFVDPAHERANIGALLKTTTTTTITKLSGVATRAGKKTTYSSETIKKDLGERTVGMNYIPYMRTIEVLVKVTKMKPGCLLYTFFDEVDIGSYVTPASRAEISNYSNGAFYTNYGAEEYVIGQQSGAKAKIMVATPTYVLLLDDRRAPADSKANLPRGYTGVSGFIDGEIIIGEESGAKCTIDSIVVAVEGDDVYSHNKGEVSVLLRIPNEGETGLRFKTGERMLVFNDQPLNTEPNQTFAEGLFKSIGYMLHQENTVLSTKTIKMKTETIRQQKAISKTVVSTSVKKMYHDPLAQTFLVSEKGGCFITKIDVFFQKKDLEDFPVICQMRNVDNGYPGGLIFSSTEHNPEDVIVSAKKPGEPTSFVFDNPVYLMEGEEYCFVLMTDSFEYNVWVGEIGEIDLVTGDVIDKQPYNGVLFKSQNASTWTANQYQDMMFVLYKAEFDINSYANIEFVNKEVPVEVYIPNPVETYQGSNLVRFFQLNHGLFPGCKYNVQGFDDATDYNGILGADLNGIHMVEDYELDNFTIRITDSSNDPVLATESGTTGGVGISGHTNIQADVIIPNFTELLFDETYSDWAIQTTSGRSVGGDQIPWIVQDYAPCTLGENYFPSIPTVIASNYNQDEFMGDNSLKCKVVMGSDNANISPIIELSPSPRCTVVLNRIDNPTFTAFTPTAGTFDISASSDELIINYVDHQLGSGANILIEGFAGLTNTNTDYLTNDDINGIQEIRVINQDTYLIDFDKSTTSGDMYTGDGGGSCEISQSSSHYMFVPEQKSINCSAAGRYITTQVTLDDTAENFSLYFAAVREVDADFDVYYKVRGPYEVTEFGDIDWILIENPDNEILVSENLTDFRDYSYTVEDIEPYNSIAVKIVMKSKNSVQTPQFKDFRLICTT